jgi:hypothetical protein
MMLTDLVQFTIAEYTHEREHAHIHARTHAHKKHLHRSAFLSGFHALVSSVSYSYVNWAVSTPKGSTS